MSKRRFVSLSILLFVVPIVAAKTSLAERPNILLITADDLGIQLGCYGDNLAQTPALDRFSQRCVRFQTAYVTQASCSPSRSSLLTGRYPHANGQYGLTNASVEFELHPHELPNLLPNLLKKNGYRTGLVGKLHVGPEAAFQFDYRNNRGFNARDIEFQVGIAKEFFGQNPEQPWFLMFNLFDPHVARDRLADGSRGPQYFPDQVKGIPQELLTEDDVKSWPWQLVDDSEQRKKIAGYYNCIARLDLAVDRLLTELAAIDELDNTVVIFVGDHGPPFARGKTSCYESGLRVPFLLFWPSESQAHVSSRLVSTVDVYPTILDAADIDIPDDVHGQSLRSVAKPELTGAWRETLVGEFHFHGTEPFFPRRAITNGRYKLIQNLRAGRATAQTVVDGDRAFEKAMALPAEHMARVILQRLHDPPEWELYDLKVDPSELTNLSGQAGTADVEATLRKALADWQIETNDPFRDPEFVADTEKEFRRKR